MSTSTTLPVQRRRLRAPSLDGAALIEPPAADVLRYLAIAAASAESSSSSPPALPCQSPTCQVTSTTAPRKPVDEAWNVSLLGRSRRQLRQSARREVLQLARQHTLAYRDVQMDALEADSTSRPWMIAGHQPALYHCGVWFKNWLLSDLARQSGGVALNLRIDNDTCRTASIRVPTGSPTQPRLTAVEMDGAGSIVPYEQRAVLDEARWQSFPDRVAETMRPFVADPLIHELGRHWPSDGVLGERVAQARHTLEGRWGLDTLEVPLSQVSDTDSFRWFACHLLADLARFIEIHNESLWEYRRVNRVRSRSHPVPELDLDGEWLEAPFWLWSNEQPSRRRAFVRSVRGGLELSDRATASVTLPWTGDGDPDKALERLAQWRASGVKLRPRALVTTLFARLLLGDVFMHGIGGAKYDELTDRLIERYFGIEPPPFMIATATLRLPIHGVPEADRGQLLQLDRWLRDARFHPERLVTELGLAADEQRSVEAWMDAKQQSIERFNRSPSSHEAIQEANRALAGYLTDAMRETAQNRQRIANQVRAVEMLQSREFSFCLYPQQTLRTRLLELSQQAV